MLEKCANKNYMKFSKEKVLHVGWHNVLQQYTVETEKLSNFSEKDLGVLNGELAMSHR